VSASPAARLWLPLLQFVGPQLARVREDIEAARAGRQDALDDVAGRLQAVRAQISLALGTSFLERSGEPGGTDADLDAAIAALEEAFRLAPSGMGFGPDASSNLGAAYTRRVLRSSDPPADADAGVNFQAHAVQLERESPADQKTGREHVFLVRLSSALLERAALGANEDVRNSLAVARQAVAAARAERGDLPLALNQLGRALREQGRISDARQAGKDVDEAVRAFREASLAAPGEPEYANNLAAVLHERATSDDGEQARRDLSEAVRIRARLVRQARGDDPGCAVWLNNLGQSLLALSEPRTIAVARALFVRAETLDPHDARFPLNLGAALEADPPAEPAAVVDAYSRALARGRESAPEVALSAARDLARLALDHERWTEVCAAAGGGEQAFRQLYAAQCLRQDKMTRLAQATGLVLQHAYAAARLGDATGAAALLERSRVFLLADAVGKAQAAGFPVGDLDPSRLHDALARCGRPVVYVACASAGGIALVARPEGVKALWLDEASEQDLFGRLGDYSRKYSAYAETPRTYDYWEQALGAMSVWLGEKVVGPATGGLRPGEPAVLVPVGQLALLPLHAACDASGRAVLDRTAISLAPSAAAYAAACEAAAAAHSTDAVVAAVAGGLDWPPHEASAVERYFPGAVVIPEPEVTRSRVLAELEQRAVAHFACHGAADYFDPLSSYLKLTGEERLALSDFIPERIAMRLVVLSACETGVGNVAVADDVVSFPAGLLALGTAGVVASLWPVDDASTALLMARFYGGWRTKGLDPPEALRQAQIWLRDSTFDERRKLVDELVPDPPAKLLASLPDEIGRHHWAAFVYVGA
jgi:tetratricopeptide (TPR) repeat protein